MLVDTQPPFQADMIAVIGGDWFGNRILKGAELARAGYAPVVLASGSGYLYGAYECDLAIQFAERHGFARSLFIPLHYPATSTVDEAHAVIAELRRRHVAKYILVTSPFHTARAGRIFRSAGPDLQVRVVASADSLHWNDWWDTREGRKIFLLEWTKSVTGRFGF